MEIEKVEYVNQMVEKEVKKIIEVPVEEVRYEDRVTKQIGVHLCVSVCVCARARVCVCVYVCVFVCA